MYDGDDYCKMFSLGPVYEFNFYDTGESPTVFYVGALVHLAHMIADFGDADDATALLFGGRIGMRFFLTETTAFDVRLNGYFATDDIYADDGDVSPTNVSITAGFKFFL